MNPRLRLHSFAALRLAILMSFGAATAAMPWPMQHAFSQDREQIQFVDVTEQSGIDFVHHNGGGSEGYIVEGMSTGIATLDYNNDGHVDIYFLNGTALQGTRVDHPLRNTLYRNNGDWTFTDVTQQAGVGDAGYSLGVAVADYDDDGDQDIYVNNFGENVFYRNNGNETFTDVAPELGVVNGRQVGAGVGFLDIEGDGDLDLYVANYVDFRYENHVPILIDGKRFQAGPQYYQPVADSLFRNEGNGRFTDVSQSSGIAAVTGPGMGLVCADFDNDQDIDIYVCNDGQPNFLFQNDGQGKFEEIGLLAGAACDFNGKANSSMGVDCGDYDGDGLLDIFVTNYQAEMPVLYHNLGGGLFEDATSRARIPQSLFPHVNWGTAFVDIDNDADQDLYLVCGHFDRIEEIDDRTSMKVKNYLLLNEGGRFRDVTAEIGPDAQIAESSRGLAAADFDNDGDLDCLILNANARPTLLCNNMNTENHWIKIQLRQPAPNVDAVGSRVWVETEEKTQMQECVRGRGYQSSFGSVLHFGLGKTTDPVQVTVRWPDGKKERYPLPIDQLSVVHRDASP